MKHIGTLLIKTKRLILRQFTEQDSEEIYVGFRNQKEFLYYTKKGYFFAGAERVLSRDRRKV